MGRKIKVVQLTPDELESLEKGYKQLDSTVFSRRCQIVLLKSKGYSSEAIADIQGTTIQPVNTWVKRFESNGIEGLKSRPGRGRKQILSKEADGAKVRKAVQKERQRLSLAKEELERQTGKRFSHVTLRRFLKNLSADGSVSG
jgi:transposase